MSLPVFRYTEAMMRDYASKNDFPRLLHPIFIEWFKQSPENFMDLFALKAIENNYSLEEANDLLFWLNLEAVCIYDTWLFEPNESSMQWYFNTPDHPFEQYIVSIIGDKYREYTNEYPE